MIEAKKEYKRLGISTLGEHSTYAQAFSHQRNLIRMDSSALEVMTDLHFVPASTASPYAGLLTTAQQMISQGVRLLLVTDEQKHVIGLVTSRDINFDDTSDEQLVSSVMTPYSEIEVIPMDDILYAKVGDIMETLKNSNRQHALAAEFDPIRQRTIIRGIFSATQIARQLGIAIKSEEILETFNEIDRLVRNSALT